MGRVRLGVPTQLASIDGDVLTVRASAPTRMCDNGGWTDTWFAEFGTVFSIAIEPRILGGRRSLTNPRASDRVTARYQYSRQRFDNEDIILGEATQQNNREGNVGVTWTHTFSNRTVGELRYGLGVRDTNVNIKAGNDTPIIRFAGSPVSGTIIGNAGNFPINRDQIDHQFVYNVSTLLGAGHNLKAGTDVRFSALDDVAQNFNRGFWSFTANCGGVVSGGRTSTAKVAWLYWQRDEYTRDAAGLRA